MSEQHNLFWQEKDVADRLMKELFNWEKQLAHPAWRTEPFWIQYNIKLYDKKYDLTQPEGR